MGRPRTARRIEVAPGWVRRARRADGCYFGNDEAKADLLYWGIARCGWANRQPFADDIDEHHRLAIRGAVEEIWDWWQCLSPSERDDLVECSALHVETEDVRVQEAAEQIAKGWGAVIVLTDKRARVEGLQRFRRLSL